ncbi:hypothetical protein [Salegentibacter salegens]|uniref:Uncharacterized protein n=1 Tax=Salegentibacter salegens TaxID=143223 RepID=A0A1M7JAT3_9FLAO|nr:hypothetical protein [Salegentibacter salegens]PRX39292.1 hypothetical protein LY58_03363 [Salegentibacter salegens]SHM50115.1 hypothetical protein SAMN05878281_0887 [Salegentibacter salegens]
MKNWNFKVKRNPNEISENLEASIGAVNGFAFDIKSDGSNLISFKIRKRLLYAWYILYHNNVVVNGRLSNADAKGETNVDISFNQHFLWKFVIFTHLFLGLGFVIAIFLGNSDIPMYVLAAITLAIGIFLWFRLQKKYERNVQEYKKLISKTLEF